MVRASVTAQPYHGCVKVLPPAVSRSRAGWSRAPCGRARKRDDGLGRGIGAAQARDDRRRRLLRVAVPGLLDGDRRADFVGRPEGLDERIGALVEMARVADRAQQRRWGDLRSAAASRATLRSIASSAVGGGAPLALGLRAR